MLGIVTQAWTMPVNEYGTVSVEFSKEELWLHRRRHISKKELADFELFKRQSDVYATRNIGGEKELHDDVKRFLSRDRSPDVRIRI